MKHIEARTLIASTVFLASLTGCRHEPKGLVGTPGPVVVPTPGNVTPDVAGTIYQVNYDIEVRNTCSENSFAGNDVKVGEKSAPHDNAICRGSYVEDHGDGNQNLRRNVWRVIAPINEGIARDGRNNTQLFEDTFHKAVVVIDRDGDTFSIRYGETPIIVKVSELKKATLTPKPGGTSAPLSTAAVSTAEATVTAGKERIQAKPGMCYNTFGEAIDPGEGPQPSASGDWDCTGVYTTGGRYIYSQFVHVGTNSWSYVKTDIYNVLDYEYKAGKIPLNEIINGAFGNH